MTQTLALALPGRISEHDEAALVAAALTSSDAFGELYSRYLPRVYRYLRTRTETPEEAGDLTQAVFLRAYAGIARYESRAVPFSAWLFRIARNVAIDAHRRRRPTVPWELAPDTFGHDRTGASPEATAEQRERVGMLLRRLSQLSQDKREMLALRYAAGLSSAEIAALLGKTEAAVKKMLTRIIAALKEQYRDESA